MIDRKNIGPWWEDPSVKIPNLPLESPKGSRLVLAQVLKVSWSVEVISCALFCSGLVVDWLTFTIDFHGFLMMYNNVLGPRCDVPSTKIPNPP